MYCLLVFNFIYCINLIYIISTSHVSNIIDHFHSIILIFKNICVIFYFKLIFLPYMYKKNRIYLNQIESILFNSDPNQSKPHRETISIQIDI